MLKVERTNDFEDVKYEMYQIAEFARLSGVSKIVIGRSASIKKHFFNKPTLTEKLIAHAPNMDIHIIPDSIDIVKYRKTNFKKKNDFSISLRDLMKSIGILLAATLIGYAFSWLGFKEANIVTVYILAVLVIAVVTTSRLYSMVSSVVSVLVFNFFFTVPKFTFMAYDDGYPVTFLIMLTVAFITSSLAIKLKNHAKQAAHAAFRTKILFDTNQLIQKASGTNEIITATANQLIKLLGKNIVIYCCENNKLGNPHIFRANGETSEDELTTDNEKATAQWVMKNNKHAGATTDTLSGAKCMYFAIRVNSNVYGVVGIDMNDSVLDSFENSVLLSILGECALAMENEQNAKEKTC